MRATLYSAFCIALGLMLVGRARGQGDPPFTITISQVQPTLHLGDPIMIHIVLKSATQGAFDLPGDRHPAAHGEMNYFVFVTDSHGAPIPETDLMRRLKNHAPFGSRSITFRQLNLGDEVAEDLDLNNVVKIAFPGTYVIQVERADDRYGPLHIKSNQLTIHVEEQVAPSADSKPQVENTPPAENQTPDNEPDAQASQQPFVIRIHANQPQVQAGDPVDINLTMSNFSDHPIDCTARYRDSRTIDMNYQYDVLDEDGLPAPKIERKAPSETVPCTLKPMNSTYFGALLSELYDFSVPGKYSIQVSRPIWGDEQRPGTGRAVKDEDAIVKSNKIVVTVLPAGSKPTEDDPPPTQQ